MEISQVQDSIQKERKTFSQRQELVKEIIEKKAIEKAEAEKEKVEHTSKLPALLSDAALGRLRSLRLLKQKSGYASRMRS